jgi:hypothetical protein
MQEQRKNAAYLAKQRKRLERDIHRRTLAEFRRKLRDLKQRRKLALTRARMLCKRGKARARESVKTLRARERERINNEAKAIRRQACNECAHRRAKVKASAGSDADKLKRHATELERQRREVARIDRGTTGQHKAAARALERRQESDDEVLRNIGPELAGVWRKVRKQFAQAPRNRTRTEAFLEWLEANPDEVLAMQAERGEALAAKDVAELRAIERGLRKAAKRSGYSVAELQAFQRLGIDPLAPTRQASGVAPF